VALAVGLLLPAPHVAPPDPAPERWTARQPVQLDRRWKR
jgi:hypothetical protein